MQVSKMLFEYNRLGYYNAEPKLPGRDQELFRRLFNPINELIRDNEQGVWYDPSDLSTLFQDAAGTVPVTGVGQPVGLILDKSKGLALGAELIGSPIDFTNSAVWWSLALSVTQNTFTVGSAGGVATTQPIVVASKAYKLSLSWSASAAVTMEIRNGNTSSAPLIASQSGTSGTITAILLNPANGQIYLRSANGGTVTVSGFSVRELLGNHAYQTTATSRPVLSARVNLLTYSQDFGSWSSPYGNCSVTSNSTTAPDGTLTADLLVPSAASSQYKVRGSNNLISTTQESRFSVYVKSSGYSFLSFVVTNNTGRITVDFVNNTYTAYSGSLTATSTAWTNGWYRVVITIPSTISNSVIWIGPNSAMLDPSTAVASDGTSGIYIWGADLRVANESASLPAYQRVNTSTDYDTVGFPYYLSFDGVDDYLVTGSIDFTGTDKMTVFAGVRKLSDAARGMVFELGTLANNGTINLSAPAASASYSVESKGTLYGVAATASYVAPITNIVSGTGDISGSRATIRVNASQVAQSVASQGTGNYGNYPLYIGRRGGTSLPFNGNLYGLVIRGALSDANQIANAERFMNSKTGAY